MPFVYKFLQPFRLLEVKHNFVDLFDEDNQENQGRFMFDDGAMMWLARRSTLGVDNELVLYIVGIEKINSKAQLKNPNFLNPDLVIPIPMIQRIKREKVRSTGETNGQPILRGTFKILAQIDTIRGPEWFTLKMDRDDYRRCKTALRNEVPTLSLAAA